MKRILLFLSFYILSFALISAQEMMIKSMSVCPSDQNTRVELRNDLNGDPCALVRVEFPFEDVVFDGNIVGSVERHVNEYWVYLTAGSKMLEIKHPKLYTLEVSFPDYNIQSLEGLQTYKLIVQASLNADQEVKTIKVVDEIKVNLENGHEYVDLGLPSGILWATCNVGASNPEEFGDYFAWGATSPQTEYDWVHAPYQTQNTTSNSAVKFSKYWGSKSSFKTRSVKSSKAKKSVLDPEDDVAHVIWGGSWRMPNKEERDELCDTSNCTWTWTTQNGVNGYKVTSKKNNNSIFFPAVGYRFDSRLYDVGSTGQYWTSSLCMDNPDRAYCFDFLSSHVFCHVYDRCYGLSVRPVCSSAE